MEKVYVIGHKKPDTDAVTGAIALSYLKNQMGLNTEPRILGEINTETAYALKKFEVAVPRYLNDVKIQIKDVKYLKNFYVNEGDSIHSVYNYLAKKDISGIPITDNNKKYAGYVALKEIAKELIVNDTKEIKTSFTNIASTLNASIVHKFSENICGKAIIATIPYRILINSIKLDVDSIVVASDYEQILEFAIKSKVKLIIIINNGKISKEILALAKGARVNIIVTPFDNYKVARILGLTNAIKTIKRDDGINCFEPNEYLSDFLEKTRKLKHTNYPIVDSKGICEGMLRVIDTHDVSRKRVILVDHNAPEQSVDGLNEAEIIEIVDHHNISTINTNAPINFRNMSVGSVNTIIYYLYLEQAIKIPKAIAGLMLSGIISDTLLLVSPTTTELDRIVVNNLVKMLKIDLKVFGLELLQSGVSTAGLSPNEVIYKDLKNYTVADNKIGIAQVFTTSFKDYEKNINAYTERLNEVADYNDYKILTLFITDIINNNSYILFNNRAKKYLEDAYNVTDLNEGHLLEGVVSRKKQIVPLIMEVIEKR